MSKLILLAELVGVLLVAAGVALWSVPAALVVMGIAVIAVCEIHGARTKPEADK